MPYSWEEIKEYNSYLNEDGEEVNILLQYAGYGRLEGLHKASQKGNVKITWETLKRMLEWIDSYPPPKKYVLITLYVEGLLENYEAICSGEKYERLKNEGVTEWLTKENFCSWIKEQNDRNINLIKQDVCIYWENICTAWVYGRLFCKALTSNPIFKWKVILSPMHKSAKLNIQKECFSSLSLMPMQIRKEVLLREVDPDKERAKWTLNRLIKSVLGCQKKHIEIDDTVLVGSTEEHDDEIFKTVDPRDVRKTPDETSEERQMRNKTQELFTRLYRENPKQGFIFWLDLNIVKQSYKEQKQPTQGELCKFFTTLGGVSNFSQHASNAEIRFRQYLKESKDIK